MSLQQAAAAVVGGLATAAYLDARYLLRNDLREGSVTRRTRKATDFVVGEFAKGKGLVYHYFEDHALGKNADNIFLIFEGRSWTYKEFYDEVQLVGNWLMNDLQVQKDEMVALDGPNSPEYVMFILALSGIGACSAYINSNLTSAPMVHSVKLCGARYLLADRAVQDLVQPCEDALSNSSIKTVYYHDGFAASLKDQRPLPKARREGASPTATARLIYTSGTTGLPKGVMLARSRELASAKGVSDYLGLKPGVRLYTCLPLYHVSGQYLCTVPSIFAGSTVVLSRKFSHKTFWPEVRSSQAEIIQYVGELARYLLNAPPSPTDKQHNVRMLWGNGIRPDVWEPFRQRFGVETINEIYGATDGFTTCWNENRGPFGRNAIAVRGPIWHFLNGAGEKRIRIDIDTEEIIRDPVTGFAVACKADEAGESIHKVVDPAMQTAAFAKYFNNSEAGLKRRIQDVFEKGDIWFRTGDMLKQDAEGRLYFVDRLGDTFRWHSENVSTNEVSDVFGRFEQVAETNVYGVAVPYADGRAGCAAIVPAAGSQLDLGALTRHALANLPRYAVPLFIRIVKEMDYTATNKMQKGRLKADGIDWNKIRQTGSEDSFYWLPPGASTYVPYGSKEWESISSGAVKL